MMKLKGKKSNHTKNLKITIQKIRIKITIITIINK